jgi:hypothetical protein
MRIIAVILGGLTLSLFATSGLPQATPPPKEMRSLRERAPVEALANPNIQVIDLRTAVASSNMPSRPTSDTQTLAARKAEPGATRSLAAQELGAALRGARIALATQNVYVTVTPGHLVVDGKAITRVSLGIDRIEPDRLVLLIGKSGGIDVQLMLHDSGVYLLDYTYTYHGGGSAVCLIEHRDISQAAGLTRWSNGDGASHIVVAVNYVAPTQWPTFSSYFDSVELWCDSEESNESLTLYSINVVRP